MELTDRVVVITGGKRIGRCVATELAARGADVVVSYRGSKAEADLTVRDVQARGRRALAVRADVSRAAEVSELIEQAVRRFGRLDVLINMASIYRARPFDELTEVEWDEDLAINLKAAYLCAAAAVPHMRRGGEGRIINIADWVARSGRPRYKGYLSYYVAKAGVIALTEALALELADDNILVNAIAPGPIVAPPGTTLEEQADVAKATPLGRWGGEIEIAKAVVALIDADFITGETVRVDGGRHVS